MSPPLLSQGPETQWGSFCLPRDPPSNFTLACCLMHGSLISQAKKEHNSPFNNKISSNSKFNIFQQHASLNQLDHRFVFEKKKKKERFHWLAALDCMKSWTLSHLGGGSVVEIKCLLRPPLCLSACRDSDACCYLYCYRVSEWVDLCTLVLCHILVVQGVGVYYFCYWID